MGCYCFWNIGNEACTISICSVATSQVEEDWRATSQVWGFVSQLWCMFIVYYLRRHTLVKKKLASPILIVPFVLCDLFTLLKCYLNILVKNWNNQGIHLICFSTLFKCLLLFHHLCQEGHSKINFNTSGERKVQQVVLRFYGSLHHSLSRYSVSLFSYFLLPLLYINVFLYGDRVVSPSYAFTWTVKLSNWCEN